MIFKSHKKTEEEISKEVQERTRQIKDDYDRRLQELEIKVKTPLLGTINDLEEDADKLEEENRQLSKQLSERPTQEELEKLRKELYTQKETHQKEIRELRKKTLKISEPPPDKLDKIKILRYATHLVVAPQENPLHLASYFIKNPEKTPNSTPPAYLLVTRNGLFDLIVNLRSLKELIMFGFSIPPEAISSFDKQKTMEGKITLVQENKYEVPYTIHNQVTVYTLEDYMKDTGRDYRRIVSLVRRVDSKDRSDDIRVLVDALRFTTPLTDDIAISLAYHLAKSEKLANFLYLTELQDRASYFVD